MTYHDVAKPGSSPVAPPPPLTRSNHRQRRHVEAAGPGRYAIIAFLPVVKLRDIYPQFATLLAVLGLILLVLPLLFGHNHRLDRGLR